MGMGKASPPIPAPQPQVVVPQSDDASIKMEEQRAAAAAKSREGTSGHLLSGKSSASDEPDAQRRRLLAGNVGIG